jgi:hypothetical protein
MRDAVSPHRRNTEFVPQMFSLRVLEACKGVSLVTRIGALRSRAVCFLPDGGAEVACRLTSCSSTVRIGILVRLEQVGTAVVGYQRLAAGQQRLRRWSSTRVRVRQMTRSARHLAITGMKRTGIVGGPIR